MAYLSLAFGLLGMASGFCALYVASRKERTHGNHR
jgi:hypothetical protein